MGKEVLQVLRRVLAGVESAQAECHTFGDLISRWSSGWMAGTLHFPSLVWQHAAPWAGTCATIPTAVQTQCHCALHCELPKDPSLCRDCNYQL